MKRAMTRVMAPLALIALVALAGCNTMDGVGRDISGASQRLGGMM